ncbi:unnamed protein product [Notodromas monacha]|uniref:C2H2-type domain-containing protein n=1 Tax=Notodromas monacha TaxID=399045 RepID=A0A7R9BER4_9CRUS|nr:unnamed protein product [Notodromas monacha]CAG0913466.1 unnamed protein product [Notodromas monacha]
MPRMRRGVASKVAECCLCTVRSPESCGRKTLETELKSGDSAREFLLEHKLVGLWVLETKAVDICDKCFALVESCDDLMAQFRNKLQLCRDIKSKRIKHGAAPGTFAETDDSEKVYGRGIRGRRRTTGLASASVTVPKKARHRSPSLELGEDASSKECSIVSQDLIEDNMCIKVEFVNGEEIDLSPSNPEEETVQYIDVIQPSDEEFEPSFNYEEFEVEYESAEEGTSEEAAESKKDYREWSSEDPACSDPRPFQVIRSKGASKYYIDGFIFNYVRATKSDKDIIFVRCNHYRVAGVECPVIGAINMSEKRFYYDPVTRKTNHNHLHAAIQADAEYISYASIVEREPEFQRCILANGKKGFACDLCSYSARTQTCLVSHMKAMHRIPDQDECFECGRCLESHEEYLKHMDRHRADYREKVTCISCRAPMQKKSLAFHVRAYHKGQILFNDEQRKEAGLDMMKCAICKFKVDGKSLFHLHALQAHYGEKAYGCEFCEKTFPSYRSLRDHLNVAHTKTAEFECKDCDAKFLTRVQYQRHRELHQPLQGRKLCSDCGITLPSAGYRDHLVLVHNHPAKRECKYCGQKLATYNMLRSHMILEHGVEFPKQKRKIRVCEDCGRSYTSATAYTSHRIKHHGDLPVDEDFPTCTYCGSEFLTKIILREHYKNSHGWYFVEQVEKGIQCKYCGVYSRDKYLFQNHLKLAHQLDCTIKTIRAHMRVPEGAKKPLVPKVKTETEEMDPDLIVQTV